jgi:hypothetical protein
MRWLGVVVVATILSLAPSRCEAFQSPSSLSSEVLVDAPEPAGWEESGQVQASGAASPAMVPCGPATNEEASAAQTGTARPPPCPETPLKPFLSSPPVVPLTSAQKGKLALHDLKDPATLATIAGNSALTIATDSHTAYGPGWKGFGLLSGYSFVQDATGEFFGTFLIPLLTHEDPRYHRMPQAKFMRRVLHVVARTVVAQSDTGKTMPNYASLLTNPICAEISNLYVPGVATNGPSTVDRILLGYANEPIGVAVAEFLPDVASHIHVQIIFVQRILNQISGQQYPFTGKSPQPPQPSVPTGP